MRNAVYPIGGYFSLEARPGRGPAWLRDGQGFESARQALAAWLAAERPSALWLPHHVCGVVAAAARHCGIPLRRYRLGPACGAPLDLPVDAGERVLCVDYHGLRGAAVDAAIAQYGADSVIVDASQALFHRPRAGVATVYSPRKFVGVPDGGLLHAPRQVPPPPPGDAHASIERCRPLLSRLAGMTAEGHAQFQRAEASLDACEPRALSTLTRALLDAIDFGAVAERRIANYARLAAALHDAGLRAPALPADAVPLSCPVPVPVAADVRAALARAQIFTPLYWPDAALPPDDPVGLALRDGTIHLPCDQRYDAADMDRVALSLIAALRQSQVRTHQESE